MATDYTGIKSYESSDRHKYMEHNRICALGGPECIMKFSCLQKESPPPKPPRRRYSDQLSAPSSGTFTPNKKPNEEFHRGDSNSKRCSLKPAYLSLPSNLTATTLTEHDDTSKLLSSSPLKQFTDSRENEFYVKYFLENLKFSESNIKKTFSCYQFNKEKLQSVNPCMKNDHIISKYQYDNLAPCIIDEFLRNSTNKHKVYMPSNCINHNQKSAHKDSHRRHHSDPAISHFSFEKDNSVKLDLEHCCDKIFLPKQANKHCNCIGNCSCCRKNYLIMQEARILKEINEKLWQHLCTSQSCLENMKKKIYDECSDVSVSDLLSSIYYAQRAKDSAMEERLKLALEERDVALQELDDLVHVLTKSCDFLEGEKEVDKDMKDLLGEIGCTISPPRLLKYQRKLLAQIDSIKSSKKDNLSYQLRQTTLERDNALAKVKKLEEDVKNMKICYDMWYSDNKHWEGTMFDVLNQVMLQRDTVLSKVDNGLDIGNIIYRSPITSKLESVEPNVSPFEHRSKTIESLKHHPSLHMSDYKQQSVATSDEVRQLKEEIILLNKALECEKKKRELSEGKCLRLERLIHILRKKVNGQNIGVPV